MTQRIVLIFVVVGILAAGILAYAGNIFKGNSQNDNSIQPSTQLSNEASAAADVVESDINVAQKVTEQFYLSYQECMKNPPAAAKGRVSIYCQENNPYISKAFAKNLDTGGVAKAGADPVVCAQNLPESINSISKGAVSGSNTTVVVSEVFGGAPPVNVTVSLVMGKSQWEVDNITCPKP